ncbi:unnamed protein product [Rotaria sordida]|uniref:Uncharacterized protein n=1 Tax=Rotaria sordida TaxID=392033 RepID=A0A816DJV8_9BILA|nr:unnamed protein product [Rotaria sordida]CAF1639506.1 unnamed protein product [Rotaria sordida]
MSSSTSSRNINQNDLPDDIFNYNNERFYDYIKQSYGDDLAGLLSFQAIRNGLHLVETSCDDILSIFQQESEEINKLRQLCCFKIGNDKYEIKLGVKLAINSLIELLKVKQEEQKKKKKQTSTKRTSSNIDTLKSVDQFQSQNGMIAPPTIAASPDSDIPSTPLVLQLIQNRLNDIDHITDIEQRINKWWRTYNDNNNLFLSEGTHYLLEINKSINDTYACILSCKCRIRFKLPFMTTGFFKIISILSTLEGKTMLYNTRKKDNNSISNENSANRTNISSKRTRSPSRETASNTKESILKKSKSSSSSSSSNNKHIDQD